VIISLAIKRKKWRENEEMAIYCFDTVTRKILKEPVNKTTAEKIYIFLFLCGISQRFYQIFVWVKKRTHEILKQERFTFSTKREQNCINTNKWRRDIILNFKKKRMILKKKKVWDEKFSSKEVGTTKNSWIEPSENNLLYSVIRIFFEENPSNICEELFLVSETGDV